MFARKNCTLGTDINSACEESNIYPLEIAVNISCQEIRPEGTSLLVL